MIDMQTRLGVDKVKPKVWFKYMGGLIWSFLL